MVLTIPDVNDGVKLHKFCAERKPKVRLEFMDAVYGNVDDLKRIAFNGDSAVFRAGMFSG